MKTRRIPRKEKKILRKSLIKDLESSKFVIVKANTYKEGTRMHIGIKKVR